MIIRLESVASAIDEYSLMVYATYQNGGIDETSGKHLNEQSKTWNDCLSFKDKCIVEHLKDIKNYIK